MAHQSLIQPFPPFSRREKGERHGIACHLGDREKGSVAATLDHGEFGGRPDRTRG